MALSQRTPFRQMARLYGAILGVSQSLAVLARKDGRDDLRQTERELAEIKEALHALAPVPPEVETEDVALHSLLGFRLLLDRKSLVDRHLIATGEWEAEQFAYLAWLSERFRGMPHAVFVDIGAYWGLYSLVAHRSGVFNQIIAFEADRHNHAQLQTNLLLNNALKAVRTVHKAVGATDGTLFMRDSTSHPDGNRGGVGVAREDEGLPGVHMDATTVDTAVPVKGSHILIKIDVEGFEAKVLRGMTDLVANNKVVMQVEIFDIHMADAAVEIKRLGLRQIHCVHPDYYLTNMTVDELGI